jgi:hypothetical protein
MAHRGTARHTSGRWLAEELDTRSTDRRAYLATLVAAVLPGPADDAAARLSARRFRRAEFPRATLAERNAPAATLVAAVFTRSANRFVAGLAAAQLLRARRTGRNADSPAVRAARRPCQAEHRRTRVSVERHAGASATHPTGGRVAAGFRSPDAGIPIRAGHVHPTAAGRALVTKLGRDASPRYEHCRAAGDRRQHAATRSPSSEPFRPAIELPTVHQPLLLVSRFRHSFVHASLNAKAGSSVPCDRSSPAGSIYVSFKCPAILHALDAREGTRAGIS